MATPGVKITLSEHEADSEGPKQLTTALRAAAAHGNYLAADRLDCQLACDVVCRWTSMPSVQEWKALKRLRRFLNGCPRLVCEFRQQNATTLDTHTDTDWAGCTTTRKYTLGGCVMFGSHAIKHWSSMQASIAFGSRKAEFAGVL